MILTAKDSNDSFHYYFEAHYCDLRVLRTVRVHFNEWNQAESDMTTFDGEITGRAPAGR